MHNAHTLPKGERLNSYKKINQLFDRNAKDNHSFLVHPYRVVFFQEGEGASFPEILISVPKRNFKKAVQRNRIKRLTRESYRLQKVMFSKKTYIAFLYIAKEIPDFALTQKTIGQILAKILKKDNPAEGL